MIEKKNWEVTLSYTMKHEDTYLIKNVSKEDAKWIAENQNASPLHDCTLIKAYKTGEIEDEVLMIEEVK